MLLVHFMRSKGNESLLLYKRVCSHRTEDILQLVSVCASHWCPSGVVGASGGRLLVVSATTHLHLCDLQRVGVLLPVIPDYPLCID